ncbi:MAG: hypothetical protein RL274_2358 [Pseudomonadota bacterium]|jgi:hypothetical protein
MLSASTTLWLRRLVILLWVVATIGLAVLAWKTLFAPPSDPGRETFYEPGSSAVIERPGGHAYQYIAAPNLTWNAARDAAARMTHKGRKGYLATIIDAEEFQWVLANIVPEDTDVVYLGGRQTAPNEWRWVTGPEAAAEDGKGLLFWTGMEHGSAPEGRFATWLPTAFQHGGKSDVPNVCCLTIFSYRKRQFSTALGNGDPEEGVAGYLVEFGE